MRLDWQRRAVILFAASLLILSVVLVVFALREARRETLLRQQEIAGERQRAAEAVAARAEAFIAKTEALFLERSARAPGAPTEPDLPPAAVVSKSALAEMPLISEVLLVDREGRVDFVTSKPLYLLPGEKRGSRDVTAALENNALWKEAEAAEFRLRDYSGAVSLYRRLAASAGDPAVAGLLLNRVGRCFWKWGRGEQAIAAYREQLRAGSPDLAAGGVLLAAAALRQIAAIQSDDGRAGEAAATLLELCRGLLDSRWPLDEPQFEFYLGQAHGDLRRTIDSLDADARIPWSRTMAGLADDERARRVETALLGKAAERIVPLMKLEAGGSGPGPGGFRHAAESTEAGLLLASFIPWRGQAVLGLLLDPEVLGRELTSSDPGAAGLRAGWSIEIAGETGAALVSTASSGSRDSSASGRRPVLSAGFVRSFPPWTINLYDDGAGDVEQRYLMRRNLYLLALAAVFAALLFGGFLAIRSTARELKLARLKSDFVATVSHEFRTPLTSIRYMAELLERGRVPQEERRRKYYETIGAESERLGRLVENILHLSRIEAGVKEYRLEDTDVGALAEETASRFRRQSVLREIRLETAIAGGMPHLRADKEALSRALLNLLDNAVKYSAGEPRIALQAWADGDRVCLQVTDTGVGISPAEQRRIFEKFYRARAAQESCVTGSGIGLPIVDHIVRAHGGQVRLESEPGKGTRVTIELPAGPPSGTNPGDSRPR